MKQLRNLPKGHFIAYGLLGLAVALFATGIALFSVSGDAEKASASSTIQTVCPLPETDPVVIQDQVGTLKIATNSLESDVVCVVVLTNGNDRIIPVARSFGGGSWEQYEGSSFVKMEVDCEESTDGTEASESGKGCSMNLPPAENFQYSLFSTRQASAIFASDNIIVPNPMTPSAMPSITPLPSSMPSISPSSSHAPTVTQQPSSAPTITTLECPQVNETSLDIQQPGPIRLHLSEGESLCLLVMTDGANRLVPVARSYSGYLWERYVGLDLPKVGIECEGEKGPCILDLPPAEEGTFYAMSTWTYSFKRPQDEYARFLEQATFGPTLADIEGFMIEERNIFTSSPNPVTRMAKWVQHQQHEVDPTYHREFFRLHANVRFKIASPYGVPTHPCQKNTFYRRFAFTHKDNGQIVQIQTRSNGKKALVLNNVIVTLVDGPVSYFVDSFGLQTVEVPDGRYEICSRPGHSVGGTLRLLNGENCVDVRFGSVWGNPPIEFLDPIIPEFTVDLSSSVDQSDVEYYDSQTPSVQVLRTSMALENPLCEKIVWGKGTYPTFFGRFEGSYFVHDPRFVLQQNSLLSPLLDGGASVVQQVAGGEKVYALNCASADRSFLNEDSCVLSSDYTCGSSTGAFEVELSARNLQIINTELRSSTFLFSVEALRLLEDPDAKSPCQSDARSKWIPTTKSAQECGVENSLESQTIEALALLIAGTSSKSALVREVIVDGDPQCGPSDVDRIEFEVFVDGVCFRNAHPDLLSVFSVDLTEINDPLVSALNLPGLAYSNSTSLVYPSFYDMAAWGRIMSSFSRIGILEGTMSYTDLPEEVQTPELSISLGESLYGSGEVVCGSPGEVSNDLTNGGEVNRGAFDLPTPLNETSTFFDFDEQKEVVWANVSLASTDQLRQRVAWALLYIFPITEGLDGRTKSEDFTAYYDIFVRNAFGNYGRILKEITYNVLMANQLTFINSRSTGAVWTESQILQYPDENYARELLQLFSIGLYKLNMDGSVVLDDSGNPIRTYSNDDIMEFSKVFTGHRARGWRGNSMANEGNRNDPMLIQAPDRDGFPKLGFDGRYIGHGLPLCEHLPEKHWLKKGAKYILLGSKPHPLLQDSPPEWLVNETNAIRLSVEKTAKNANSLYAILCNAEEDALYCNFKSSVTLKENLECTGSECDMATPQVIEVEEGIFYEYQRSACIQHAFFDNATKIKTQGVGEKAYMCANPLLEEAAAACCLESGFSTFALSQERFWGERVKAHEADSRCKQAPGNQSASLCFSAGPLTVANAPPYAQPFYWMGDVVCDQRVKLKNDGRIAVVHSVPDEDPSQPHKKLVVEEDTKSFFRAVWSDEEALESFLATCHDHVTCSTSTDDGSCICDITITTSAAFFSMPTREEVLSIRIGSSTPDLLGVDAFRTISENGVIAHTPLEEQDFSEATIFEVLDDFGRTQYRRNLKSMIAIDGSDLEFPNPAHLHSIAEPTARDAYYEDESLLEQVLFHDNTAPFLAVRLAQRFGFSNPSARFVTTICDSFRKGQYVYNDGLEELVFGSGEYGDIGATVATILLDREARNSVLSLDPFHGSVREPLLKVIGLLRGLHFQPTPSFPLLRFRADLQQFIGQMVYKAPSIFSFFHSEHQAPGAVAQAGMFSPEMQTHSFPNIIAMTNGMLALVKYGLDRCFGGFGYTLDFDNDCFDRQPGVFEKMSGYLSFSPSQGEAGDVVDELATILTAGRLHEDKRNLITNIIANETSRSLAAIKAQQLILASSEFHTTGMVQPTLRPRSNSYREKQSHRDYKAVVVVMLPGGFDSYNFVIPHSCSATNPAGQTIREQYDDERGLLKMESAERTLIIDVEGQPCEKFALHQRMTMAKTLFDDGDLAFFMNTGVINKPVTRDDFESQTVTQLFAHNAMQHALQKVDPFDIVARSGVLGRLVDVLNSESNGYSAQGIAINHQFHAVNGNFSSTIISEYGPQEFNDKPFGEEIDFDPRPFIDQMNGENAMYSNVFAETFADFFSRAIQENEYLGTAVNDVQLDTNCGSRRLNMVVKMMQTRQARGVDRDVFFLELGSWDHHMELKPNLDTQFRQLNEALSCYTRNVKAAGLWDNVTLVLKSDFGRTLTPNSQQGSDHGWSGHYAVVSGALQPQKIIGQYPTDITADSPLNVGRGRLIPKLSWESMWWPILQWAGLSKEEELTHVLPNARQAGAPLLPATLLFKGYTIDN